MRARAQRNANPEVPRLLTHGVGDHPVHAERGEQQRDGGKRREQQRCRSVTATPTRPRPRSWCPSSYVGTSGSTDATTRRISCSSPAGGSAVRRTKVVPSGNRRYGRERRRLGCGLERRVIRIAHDADDLSARDAQRCPGLEPPCQKRVRQVLPDRVLPREVAVCQGLVDHDHSDSVAPVLVLGKRAAAHKRHPHGVKEVGGDRDGAGTRAPCPARVAACHRS